MRAPCATTSRRHELKLVSTTLLMRSLASRAMRAHKHCDSLFTIGVRSPTPPGTQRLRCQLLYFCNSTASNPSTWIPAAVVSAPFEPHVHAARGQHIEACHESGTSRGMRRSRYGASATQGTAIDDFACHAPTAVSDRSNIIHLAH